MRQLFTPSGEQIIVRAILAVDQNFALGYGDDLIFNNPKDLEMFKMKTLNHVCVMGRKTFDSIGRILPKRQTVIVTHNTKDTAKAIEKMRLPKDTPMPVVTSKPFDDLPQIVEEYGKPKIWICGGASIYEMFAPMVNTWLVTQYHIDVVASEDHRFLPEKFDPEKVVYCHPNMSSYARYVTESGYFMGVRYGVYAFSRNTLPSSKANIDLNKTYDNDTMFYQYLSERADRTTSHFER